MSTVLVLALPFAVVFMALSNELNWQGLLVGYLLSALVLGMGRAYRLNLKPQKVPSQVWNLLVYAFRLSIDIFFSSVQVARMVLSPNINAQIDPDVTTITTGDPTNNEIITAMSSHGITITPGQMVIDIDKQEDKTVLYVHNLNKNFSSDLEGEQANRLRLIRRILGYE
ncbi:MAG: Na+/H+ antiporter subunit E [Chloroflexota bacterium]